MPASTGTGGSLSPILGAMSKSRKRCHCLLMGYRINITISHKAKHKGPRVLDHSPEFWNQTHDRAGSVERWMCLCDLVCLSLEH